MPPEPVRVLLVDDEPLVRAGLRCVLAAQPGVEIAGEAGDGLAAVEAIERLRPQVVFLDVQMPGLDGFGVLAHVANAARPVVVFVTAFEQYALRAFEAHAVDYLLKPFDDARLLGALARALAWVERSPPGGDGDGRVAALLDAVASVRGRDRFVVKHGGRLRLVHAADITWVEARGNYVHLHADGGPFLVRETIAALAHALPRERFLRVHRSAIVALPEVAAVRRLGGGDQELVLRGGECVPIGRSFRETFLTRWGGRTS